jgi:hypothetical protein
MITTDIATRTAVMVELTEAFDTRWSRLPGIQVEGRCIAIDPAENFFRFESNTLSPTGSGSSPSSCRQTRRLEWRRAARARLHQAAR